MRATRHLDVGAACARVAAFSARRAAAVVAVTALLSAAGLVLALMLDPGRSASPAGNGGGEAAAATADLRARFGEDPIVVLVRGRLTGMLLTEDVGRMLSLEGCISGNIPRDAEPAAPVCSDFARRKPVQVVYGPGTFINEAANQVLDRIHFDRGREAAEADRAAREARRVARRRGLSKAQEEEFAQQARRIVSANYAQRALELAVRFGLSSVPALNNPEFVLQLVFEPSLGAEFPKPRFAYLFPHSDAAVIQARLRPGLTADERGEAVEMVREAVAAKPFQLKFGSYVVSGSPVVAEGVAAGLSDAAPALIAAALLLVALALVLTFRRRPVLLPLALGGGAAAITLGGMSLGGGSFSAGVAAALPLICALGAGWALELLAGLGPEPVAGARSAGPRIALAALASAAAFAVLLLSPVSMTRSFGAVVAVGLLVALALTLTAGTALTAGRDELARRLAPAGARLASVGRRLRAPARPRGAGRRLRTAVAPVGALVGSLWERLGGARRVLTRVRAPRRVAGIASRSGAIARSALAALAAVPAVLARSWSAARRASHERPGRVLRVAVVLAALGWVAATQIDVTSDPQRLLAADTLEARDLGSIERETGTPGDVNLIVRSQRLLDPAVVSWMSSYQRRVLRSNGFREGRPCREADLCPALSLTNLFGSGRQSARQIRAAVDAMPRYFSQNVITPDRRTANIAFRIGALSPTRRREVIASLRADLNPPAGVDAQLAGPVVAAADGAADLERSMWLVTLAALLAVTGLSALGARRLEAGLLVAIPLALAAGWTFLVLYVLPIDVDFLTAGLAAIVVAVCAGPAVLARDPRPAQESPGGANAVAFGAVAVAGFLALTVCDVPALRDLGVAGAVSLTVSGAGLALAVPATRVWAERRGGLRIPRTRAELAGAARSLGGSAGVAVRATAARVRRGALAVRRAVPRAGRRIRAAVASRR